MRNRVLFVLGTVWASGYYRMEQPALKMKQMGYPVDIALESSVDILHRRVKLYGTKEFAPLSEYKTVCFQLVSSEHGLSCMRFMSSPEVTIVHELDDDYFNLPAHNASFITFHPYAQLRKNEDGTVYARRANERVNPRLDNLVEACRIADYMQVSTPELGDLYKHLPKKGTVVLENSVENHLYDAIPKQENEIPVIGWFGTRTHFDDLANMYQAIPDNAKFVLAGYPEVGNRLWGEQIPKNVELLPVYRLEELPKIVSQMDFGVVPLEECKFNNGKSDLKGVEFGAGWCPVIASNVNPYKRWIRHGENGFIVKGNKFADWQKYIKRLVADKELRQRMGAAAKKDAVKRDIKITVKDWIDFYFGKGV